MDFFGHQERARRASGWLVVLFGAAVVAIVGCVYAAAQALLLAGDVRGGPSDLEVLGAVAAGTIGVITIASLFKTAQLRGGGSKVALLLGGTPVPPDTTDPQERMLRNVVEEMAIASGVPVPDVFVLQGERGLNAFAAGWSTADAAVAVTRGCLDSLDRDELQGVIAHEFSHVFHGDMRLNIRLIGVLFGIVCIATIGRILVRSIGRSSRSNRKGGAAGIVLFGVALIVIGWLGVLFSRLIQAAVSRQREFLADASAVQYTRNPRGIGMALAKIGGLSSRLDSPHTEETSHLLFADGMSRAFGRALATHPPLEQRIERVLPGFGRQLREAPSLVAAAAATPLPAQFAAAAPGGGRATRTAPALVAAVGTPQAEHVAAARALLAELPLDLAAATHEPARAGALALALLLDADPGRRARQLALLPSGEPALLHGVHDAVAAVAGLDRSLRLSLVELAVPALRRLSAPERRTLRTAARALALADGALSPFEFALLRTVERHVPLPGDLPVRPSGRPAGLADHHPAAAAVLSVLARAGARGDEARAARAFARGRAALGSPPDLTLLPAGQVGAAAFEDAVARLSTVSSLGKRNLLTACAEAAADDGVLDPDETDLVRALALLWDCPVPLPPRRA